jgi:hypothetical protein
LDRKACSFKLLGNYRTDLKDEQKIKAKEKKKKQAKEHSFAENEKKMMI